MKELLKLAETLGEKISGSDRYKKLIAAENAVDDNEEAKSLLENYMKHNNKLAELETSGGAIEPEDKKTMMELAEKLHANSCMQELVKAQADFAELMNGINSSIQNKVQKRADG